MGIEELGKIASELGEKASGLLKSEHVEGISDAVLDGAAGLANTVTGGKFADQVEDVRNGLDGMIGDQ